MPLTPSPVLPIDFRKDPYLVLDFTGNNPDLAVLDLTDSAAFSDYVSGKLRQAGALVGVGGYRENRVIYRRSPHFQQTAEPRSIHLGIDLWTAAGTPVLAPLDGAVHSFQHNDRFGDYGPTIILEHLVEETPLYSLYGHLSIDSLVGLETGMRVRQGQELARIGPYPENGDWPPHLHFQLMTDLLGWKGDFPGVCSPAEEPFFAAICPDPNLILQIPDL